MPDNVLFFNDKWFTTDDFIILSGEKYPLFPVTRVESIELPNGGSIFIRRTNKATYIELPILFQAESNAALLQKKRSLAADLYSKVSERLDPKPAKLILSNEDDKYYMAILDGQIPLEKKPAAMKCLLSFKLINNKPDQPIAYSTINTIENNIDGVVLTNSGSYPTKGVITTTLTSDINSLEIALAGTDNKLTILGQMISGDQIEVDFENYTFKVNDIEQPGMISPALMSWFSIPPGDFAINFTPSINANLTYTERWI